MWVNMNNPGSKLFGFDNIGKAYRMGLCHVAAHNQNTVAIDQVLWESCGTATSERSTQTGYSGAVSYTGLILNRNDPQTGIEELFDHVVLFIIQCCSAKRGDTNCLIDLAPIR